MVAMMELPIFATKLIYTVMTDYEYILKQARKFHYSKWTDEELRKCVDMLPNLSREELTALTMNKWTREAKILRENIFNILFKEQIGKREERIKSMETKDLIAEFQDRKSGNVSLVRKEMQNRYKYLRLRPEQGCSSCKHRYVLHSL